MAEDIRAVLPQLHEEHPEQHGVEAAAMAEHDLHLERGVVLITVVGQVSVTAKLYAISCAIFSEISLLRLD